MDRGRFNYGCRVFVTPRKQRTVFVRQDLQNIKFTDLRQYRQKNFIYIFLRKTKVYVIFKYYGILLC